MLRSLFIFLFCSFSIVYAEPSIQGTIKDALTLKPIKDVNIKIGKITVTSRSNGNYMINNIKPGSYHIQFSKQGYKTIKQKIQIKTKKKILNINLLDNKTFKGKELIISDEKPAYKRPTPSKIRLKQDTIKKTSGVKEDIVETVKTLPGTATQDDFTTLFSVRGGDPDENNIFFDDVYIISPYHLDLFGPSAGFVSILNNELIEQANFYSGAFPAEFRSTMSSVLDIKGKKAQKTQGNLKWSFLDVKGFVEIPFDENGGLLLAVRRNYQDKIIEILQNMDVIDDNFTFPSFYDTHIKFDYNITKSDSITIYNINAGNYMWFDLSGTATKADQKQYEYTQKWSWESKQNLVYTRWNHKFGDRLTSGLILSVERKYWDSQRSKTSEYPYDNFSTYGKNDYYVFQIKEILEYSLADSHTIKWGIGYYPAELNFDMKIPKFVFYQEAPPKQQPREFTITKWNENWYYFDTYIQDQWEMAKRLTANLGVNYGYTSISKNDYISPRISLVYGITPYTSLRGGYGYYYQHPNVTDYIPEWGGNTSLEARLAKHYVLGAEHQLSQDIVIKLEGFYKDYSHLVSVDTNINKPNGQKNNLGDGYSKGIELFVEKKLNKKLWGWLSYTYSISKKRDYKDSNLYYTDFDRRHIINLIANYQMAKTWNLNLNGKYYTGRAYTPYDIDNRYINQYGEWTAPLKEKNSGRLPDYVRLDIRITKSYHFTKWDMNVYLEVLNALMCKNIYDYRIDSETGELKSIYQMPIIPVLGVEARF